MTLPNPCGIWIYPAYPNMPTAAAISGAMNDYNLSGPVYMGASLAALGSAEWLWYYISVKNALGPNRKLYATYGSPTWADAGIVAGHAEYRKAAEWVKSALTRDRAANQRIFDGVMLDVEPTWRLSATQAQMWNWISMQQQCVNEARLLHCSPPSQPAPQVWFSLPCNLHLQTVTALGTTLERALLQASDGIMFMSYRNTAPALLSFANVALQSAAAVGRQVRLCVECGDSGVALPNNVDYRGKTRTIVMKDVASVIASLHPGNGQFKGIDIHDVSSFYTLT